jgi:gluconolactonase
MQRLRSIVFQATLLLILGACTQPESSTPPDSAEGIEKMGVIERLDPALEALIAPEAFMEKLAEGMDWAEGPVWVPDGAYLLFSDIPKNAIFKWKEDSGLSVYMKPSGHAGPEAREGEPGSNGLALDAQGRLILCEHGDRRLSREDSPGEKTALADNYLGSRFNSPNDLAVHSSGAIYFTDPPYGLEKGESDPAKELDFQGVYRLTPDGQVDLLTKEMTRPNGIAFSPDESLLYVANSDPAQAVWKVFPVNDDGTLGQSEVFFDVTELVGSKPGSPDGLKVDAQGNLFATGPGGVLVFAPEGKHLGTLNTGQATANCGWGEDGSVLYITADSYLLRIQTLTKGAGW